MPDKNLTLYDVYEKLGHLEGKLNTFCEGTNKVHQELMTTSREHNNRINKLEDTTSQIVGKASIVGVIAGFIGTIVINIFLKK